MPEKVYAEAAACLGKHITLDNTVDPEVGCAEAVSYVLLKAGIHGIPQRGFAGTWDLLQWLMTNRQFVETVTPQYGGVIISATGTSSQGAQKHGHTGIILKHGIGSNDSSNGLFQENYTVDSWEHYFGVINGFPVRYFCPCA